MQYSPPLYPFSSLEINSCNTIGSYGETSSRGLARASWIFSRNVGKKKKCSLRHRFGSFIPVPRSILPPRTRKLPGEKVNLRTGEIDLKLEQQFFFFLRIATSFSLFCSRLEIAILENRNLWSNFLKCLGSDAVLSEEKLRKGFSSHRIWNLVESAGISAGD